MQASWRGEAVREVRAGLALAPWSSKSLTHSKLPAEQASHSGVLPSTFLASTWDASGDIGLYILKYFSTLPVCLITLANSFVCLSFVVCWMIYKSHPRTGRQNICLSPWLTWAPASSSRRTHCACPRRQASCSGVMESTATTLTEAPLWMRCCSWEAWPRDAALCTSVLSDQQPAGEWVTTDVDV